MRFHHQLMRFHKTAMTATITRQYSHETSGQTNHIVYNNRLFYLNLEEEGYGHVCQSILVRRDVFHHSSNVTCRYFIWS